MSMWVRSARESGVRAQLCEKQSACRGLWCVQDDEIMANMSACMTVFMNGCAEAISSCIVSWSDIRCDNRVCIRTLCMGTGWRIGHCGAPFWQQNDALTAAG